MPKAKIEDAQDDPRQSLVSECRRIKVEVEFALERSGVEQVYISGDFNGWQPVTLPMIGSPKSGLWEKRLTLEPGRYEYKFLVDGIWIHDPDAQENVPNPYGSLNSVVKVASKSIPRFPGDL